MSTVTIDADGWIKEAQGIYWPNMTFGPFTHGEPRWIVLHGTAWPNGTAQIIGESWAKQSANGTGDASVHCIIDKDGTIVQGLSLLQTAWGNSGTNTSPRASFLPTGNLNFSTISIEHCKYDSAYNSDILTLPQQVSSFLLIDAICTKYSIPKEVMTQGDCTQGGIIRHKDCDGTNRPYCPGTYPFSDLQAFLRKKPMSPFFNQMVIDLWSSQWHTSAIQPPARDTGIFNEWRAQLLSGSFRGVPISFEYPIHNQDTGIMTVGQNFAGGTCIWNGGHPAWL